jgi:hypothetical protein
MREELFIPGRYPLDVARPQIHSRRCISEDPELNVITAFLLIAVLTYPLPHEISAALITLT